MRCRISYWRATEGPPREAFFAQEHRPGSQQALNAEEANRLTEDNAPALLTTIAIEPVSLAVFDDLLKREDTAA